MLTGTVSKAHGLRGRSNKDTSACVRQTRLQVRQIGAGPALAGRLAPVQSLTDSSLIDRPACKPATETHLHQIDPPASDRPARVRQIRLRQTDLPASDRPASVRQTRLRQTDPPASDRVMPRSCRDCRWVTFQVSGEGPLFTGP